MSNHQHQGYEIYAFFGKEPESRRDPQVIPTQLDAARACAKMFEGGYVVEESGGFYVYGRSEYHPEELSPEDEVLLQGVIDGSDNLPELSFEDRAALQEFLGTPIEQHIERWKKGILWRNRKS